MHWHGRAALPRRLLADRQVSPAELAFVPMLIETAITRGLPMENHPGFWVVQYSTQ
jgi:hypothetical protein